MDQLVKLGGICIGTKVNTIVKYNTIIEIIIEAITLHTKHMNGQLDLQLALSQLNYDYHVHDLILIQKYLQVRIL